MNQYLSLYQPQNYWLDESGTLTDIFYIPAQNNYPIVFTGEGQVNFSWPKAIQVWFIPIAY
ncbi:hypothetical protein MD537_04390 [Flavihumibacter sediminis]|nr:hypothetical protein [Flavihumibacter sediminis]